MRRTTARTRGILALIAVGGIGIAVGCGAGPPPEERHVILITLDTTRADRIGAYGGERVPTPNLDRVAGDGVRFSDAISQVPLTLPAHSSMFTGRYPADHGVRHNGLYRLPDSAVTLAERLADAGYDTAGFVAAYVLNRGFGAEQGFATYDDVAVNRFEGGRDQMFEAQRNADEINAAVFRWLDERDAGRRMFLWVHYYDPHDPYDPPETPGRELAGEGYDREISYVDACLGDLLERLDRDGVLDRSILWIAGDHGESLGEHGEKTHGLFLYEGAVRIPFLLRAPGLLPAGKVVEGPVELVDIAPSVLDLVGLPPMPDAGGVSLLPRIRGEDGGAPPVAFAETMMPRLEFGWADLAMVRTSRFKYIEAPTPELYDLRDDPGEMNNLAPNDPERAGEMAEVLGAWQARNAGSEIALAASREMSAEELARLQSLGYMQSGTVEDAGDDRARPDPKDSIEEVRKLDAARDRLSEGDATGALALTDEILAGNPINHNARSTRILALLELRRYDDAVEEARAGLTLTRQDAGSSEALRHKLLGLLAGAYRLQGRLDDAERTYREMIAADPRDDNATVDLARMLSETGRAEEALALVAAVLARAPQHGMALAARFQAEIALGRRDDALRTAGALADARAGDPATLVRAGDLLMASGDPSRAATVYEVAQDQGELDPRLLGRLGEALMRAGRPDEARPMFEALTVLSPRDPRPFHALGAIALAEGDERAARERFREALARDPGFDASRRALDEIGAGP